MGDGILFSKVIVFVNRIKTALEVFIFGIVRIKYRVLGPYVHIV